MLTICMASHHTADNHVSLFTVRTFETECECWGVAMKLCPVTFSLKGCGTELCALKVPLPGLLNLLINQ